MDTVGARAQFTQLQLPPAWLNQVRRGLKWIESGRPFTIQGVETSGGFYVQTDDGPKLSFAIDPSLPVGRAENAAPFNPRPGQPFGYQYLDPDQRDVFLQLFCETCRLPQIPVDLASYARLHVANGEWRLFVEHIAPEDVVADLLDIENRFSSGRRLVWALAGFCGYLSGPKVNVMLLDDCLEKNPRLVDPTVLRLALPDYAAEKKPLSADLALVIESYFGQAREQARTSAFQERFLRNFRILYPRGLDSEIGSHRKEVSYRFECRELRQFPDARCRIRLPDCLDDTALMANIREVTRPILNGPQLKPAKLQEFQERTARTHELLRMRRASHSKPIAQPLSQKAHVALHKLMQRSEWSTVEFRLLARSSGFIPQALQEIINAWAVDTCGETLLDGDGPVVINTELVKAMKLTI